MAAHNKPSALGKRGQTPYAGTARRVLAHRVPVPFFLSQDRARSSMPLGSLGKTLFAASGGDAAGGARREIDLGPARLGRYCIGRWQSPLVKLGKMRTPP